MQPRWLGMIILTTYMFSVVENARLFQKISEAAKSRRYSVEVKLILQKQNWHQGYLNLSSLVYLEAETSSPVNRIVVRKGNAINLIPVEQIRYVEAQDDYVMIFHSSGKALKQQTMKFYEDNLPKADFVRIHRSYIVKVEAIKGIEPYGKDNHIAILHSGDKLPVSRAGYKHLKKELNF